MGFMLSNVSRNRLDTCHTLLQRLVTEVLKGDVSHECGARKAFDVSVICGFRGEADQNAAFATGKSKLQFPRSKHNRRPAMAVDIVPYPLDWQDIRSFQNMGVAVKEAWAAIPAAERTGYALAWGGDWTMRDYPHFELQKLTVA